VALKGHSSTVRYAVSLSADFGFVAKVGFFVEERPFQGRVPYRAVKPFRACGRFGVRENGTPGLKPPSLA
jgi:hypothetical protein